MFTFIPKSYFVTISVKFFIDNIVVFEICMPFANVACKSLDKEGEYGENSPDGKHIVDS